jgi:hypothetical protein
MVTQTCRRAWSLARSRIEKFGLSDWFLAFGSIGPSRRHLHFVDASEGSH